METGATPVLRFRPATSTHSTLTISPPSATPRAAPDRLVKQPGGLEKHRVKDDWEGWKSIARSFGYFFFGLGVLLLLLIIYAMVSRLAH